MRKLTGHGQRGPVVRSLLDALLAFPFCGAHLPCGLKIDRSPGEFILLALRVQDIDFLRGEVCVSEQIDT